MRSEFSQRWWLTVATLAFVSILAGQLAGPSTVNAPNRAEAQSGRAEIQSTGNEPEQEQPMHTPSSNAVLVADVETERRFNELRRELLDGRGKMVDWWLAATAIFLTLLGVAAAILGYFGFKKLDRIENEARKDMEAAKKHAEEAKSYVQEIKRSRDEAASLVKGINAKAAGKNPEKADKVVKDVQQNPGSTLLDKAVATAISLQQQNKIEEAIKKWISIANTLEGIDNELAAGAWFSVGYLRSFESEDHKSIIEAIEAYDKSIELNSRFYEAYNHLGVSKFRIHQYDSAIADFDKALVLKTDDAYIYCNRGNAKTCLSQYESAIIDFDKAINLKSDFTEAYNLRGNAKFYLSQYESAISDFDNALVLNPNYTEAYYKRSITKIKLNYINEGRKDAEKTYKLAQAAGDAELVAQAARLLENLDRGDTP